MKVRVKLLSERAIEPVQRPDGVGLDMHVIHDACIQPGQNTLVRFGIAWEIPSGYVGLVLQRSGQGSELKLVVLGVIDDAFRGEVRANLFNARQRGNWDIKTGDRVAQMLILPAPCIEIEVSTELSETSRGEAGFGSSGVK